MLKLKFLGQLKMEHDGRDLTPGVSGKAMALLAILLSRPGHRAGRRELIRYLWPDSEEEAARYNLRYNLWQLKKLIPTEPSGEHFLIITKDSCAVNERYAYTSDLSRALSARPDQTDDTAELEDLYSQFTGDFFGEQYFHGCDEFEELVVMQRYSLEHKKLQLLKKLIQIYDQSGEREKCLQALRDCEALDPYDETNAEIRIRLLADMGSFGEAVKFYQKFYHRLVRDIGTEPSQTLKSLIGKVRGQKEAAGESRGGLRERCRIAETSGNSQGSGVPQTADTDGASPSDSSKEPPVISLSAAALSRVEGYLLAEIAGALQQCGRARPEDYLSPEQLSDLSFIQPLLLSGKGKKTENVPMVRAVNAFIQLIENICARDHVLEITVSGNADPLSAEVLQLLQERCGRQLRILREADS